VTGIILCTGLRRSASTWSYNVCRELAEASSRAGSGVRVIAGYVVDSDAALERLQGSGAAARSVIAVLKCHDPGRRTLRQIAEGRVRNVCTVRDPRDCLASMERFRPRRADQTIEQRIRNFQRALAMADGFRTDSRSLLLRYEELRARPLEFVQEIARHLGVACDLATAQAVERAAGAERSAAIADSLAGKGRGGRPAFDRQTQLHERHLDGGAIGRWREAFDADLQARLHLAFLPWLLGFGYGGAELREPVLAALPDT